MVDYNNKKVTRGRSKIVGEFIKKKRQETRLSQKALGMLFEPVVTTQFISNVERGVTPLPPVHVPTLCKVLHIAEEELLKLMEREYTQKLSGKLGIETDSKPSVEVLEEDLSYFKKLYEHYRSSSPEQRSSFENEISRIFNLRKNT